jgi:hypothetical protein
MPMPFQVPKPDQWKESVNYIAQVWVKEELEIVQFTRLNDARRMECNPT